MNNENIKDEIKSRIKLSEIISQKIDLKRKNTSSFIGLCPFHKEKTPSFNVNDDKGYYHCFGCQKHGDIFNFLMEYDNINFYDALVYLAKSIGLSLNKNNSMANDYFSKKIKTLDLATKFFINQLNSEIGVDVLSYLKERLINRDVCKEFLIGYAPKSNYNQNLTNYLHENGITQEEMISLGLAKSNNNILSNYFYNRIMIPIISLSGKVVGFGGRVYKEGMPKYLNSPENEIFSKRNLLFGAYNFKKNFKKSNYLILCEGYMDVISLYISGFPAVASLGTAVSENQINILTNLSKNIFVVFDGDKAGKDATLRLFDKILPILKVDLNFKFIFIPNGYDPEEFLKKEGKDSFKNLLVKGYSVSDMIWLMGLKNKIDNTPESVAKFWNFVRDKVYQIRDKNLNLAIKDDIENRISQYRVNKKKSNYYKKNLIDLKLPIIEKNFRFKAILSIIFNYPKLFKCFENDLKKINFVDNGLHEVKEVIFSNIIADPEINKDKLNNVFKEKNIYKIETLDIEKIFSKLLLKVEDISLERSRKVLEELIYMVKKSS